MNKTELIAAVAEKAEIFEKRLRESVKGFYRCGYRAAEGWR